MLIIKILLIFIAFIISLFLILQIIGRIIRKLFHLHIYNSKKGEILSSNFRKKLQPPKTVIKRSGIKEGTIVLEIGCGSGAFTIDAAKTIGDKGLLYAVDIQDVLLEQVKDKTKALNNVKIIKASAYELPFEDNYFDLVFMVTVLPEIQDKNKALSEIKRVLKMGGGIAVTEWLVDPDYSLKSTTKKTLN